MWHLVRVQARPDARLPSWPNARLAEIGLPGRWRGPERHAASGCARGGHFPTDEAALKLLYLVLNRSEKAWKMGPREWDTAKAQFAVIFGQRFTRAMAA